MTAKYYWLQTAPGLWALTTETGALANVCTVEKRAEKDWLARVHTGKTASHAFNDRRSAAIWAVATAGKTAGIHTFEKHFTVDPTKLPPVRPKQQKERV